MRKVLLFLAISCFGISLWGQSSAADTKKLINKIKKSQSYLSAEATMSNEADAIKTANELLVNEINDWVKSKRNSETVQQIVLQDISSCTEKMNMRRGTNVRAFVYVKKSDIVLIRGEGQIVLSDNEKGTDLQALSEITEPMKIEKEKPASKKEKEKVESTVEKIGGGNSSLQAIVAAGTMTEMKKVFAGLKAKGAIKYGTYPSDALPSNYYLLFYTRTGEVKGVLVADGETFRDVSTQQEMKLSSFSGCGAYWFELK